MLKKYRVKAVRVFVRIEIVGGRVLIFWEVQTGVPRVSYFQSLKGHFFIELSSYFNANNKIDIKKCVCYYVLSRIIHIITIDW